VDDAGDAIALLADETRLLVVAALALGDSSTAAVTERTGLPDRRVLEALARLENGGLASRDAEGGWSLRLDRLREIARDARPREDPDEVGDDLDPDAARVLRTFLRGGRLTQIPLARQKRLVVLDHVCRVFDIGVRYSEREVNTYLRAFHPDTAALRRYLVDDGFLTRDHNVYWRTGGSVEV
jgi:hypothetical protein